MEFVKLATRNLLRRKVRTALTTIGIFIGIAAVVSLISITYGMKLAVEEQFERLGKDRITITAGGGEYFISSILAAAKPLSDEELKLVAKVRGVEAAAGVLIQNGDVVFKDEKKFALIVGIPTGKEKEAFKGAYEVEKGRELKESDKFACIVGNYLYGGEFFSKKVKVGSYLEILGKKFKVVGVLKKTGNKLDDSIVVVPIETLRELTGKENELSLIYAKVKPGYEPSELAKKIKKKLRLYRNEREGEESFQVQTSEQLLERANIILSLIQFILIGIATISLVVGGIGIMNTMYMSVLERTREIGVLKAIGAKDGQVMLIFLLESGLLGLIGGVVGLALGIAAAKIVELFIVAKGITFSSYMGADLIIASLLFSFFVGVISGLLPARKAAKLLPVEALRYE